MNREGDRLPPFSVGILAGGESSRMGRNKALEPLGGRPVIGHVIDALGSISRDIFIVAGDVAAYEDFGLPVCADHYDLRSSLVGAYSALASSRNDLCFTVACDMPFVESELVKLLVRQAPGHDAVVPVSDRGREPLHAVYSRSCLGRMRERIEAGDLALAGLLDALDVRYVELPEMEPLCDTSMVFLNVNTIVDLEEASALVPRSERRRELEFFHGRRSGLPPLVCFVGKKDSGKTTFLEKLIPLLTERGVKVACIKHDVHGFDMDREGTDTWRLTRAGASAVVISSPGAVASLARFEGERSLAELRAGLGGSVDLVIAEGFKHSAADRIEISRSGRSSDLACAEPDLIAVVSDRPDAAASVPVFELDDAEAIASLLSIRYGLGREGNRRHPGAVR